MRGELTIPVKNVNRLADQLCRWAQKERYAIVLRSNDYKFESPIQEKLNRYQLIAAIGADEVLIPEKNPLESFREAVKTNDWLFGFFGYDLKNEIENLSSSNFDGLQFANMLFFRPSIVFAVERDELKIFYSISKYNRQTAASLIDAIMFEPRVDGDNDSPINPQARFSKEEYLNSVRGVLEHIQRGDIYEMNLCQEFYADNVMINPYETYLTLNTISPTPFSAFGKFYDKFLLCASPERYIKKYNNKLVSQPIKGTCPRGSTKEENDDLVNRLKNDPKERSENVMIVDLVRNDLSRVALKGSVKVDELCGVYPFKQVNQMISTISCSVKEEFDIVDIIKATFPMGSMTGAPKISAMKLIEEYERTKRGLFSGAVGYIDPKGNFDFNVIIRSLLYNKSKRYLSYTVGGAITSGSKPEDEYSECLLKAKAINQALNSNM